MAKKVADSGDNSQRNQSETTSAQTTDTKQAKNVNDKKNNSVKSNGGFPKQMNMTFITTAFVIGALLTVAVSHGVQLYREKYVIPIQMDRSFPFLGGKETNETRFRTMYNPDGLPVLELMEVDRPWNPTYVAEVLVNDMLFGLKRFEVKEFDAPDPYNGGKTTMQHGDFSMTLVHIIYPNLTIGLFINTNGKPLNNSDNVTLKVSGRGVKFIQIPLSKAGVYYQTFPSDQEEPYTAHAGIDAAITDLNKNWEEKFKTWFSSTGQQELPRAYMDIMKSAYTTVASSLVVTQNLPLLGKYGFFVEEVNMFSLSSSNTDFLTKDDQLFPLMTLSKLETEDTLRVIRSYISLCNELGSMGNRISDGMVHLHRIQAPILFQIIGELVWKEEFGMEWKSMLKNLEYIADHTWKHSLGKKGLTELRWLGHSRGLFRVEPKTVSGTSSFELLCHLHKMMRVMGQVYRTAGAVPDSKWNQRYLDVSAALKLYWDEETKRYGDLVNGTITFGRSSHVPVILTVVDENSEILEQLLKNLQQDSLFTPLGLLLSEEEGAPVSTNYMLLRALKWYSVLSGPSQQLAHNMYSVLKNNMAAAIARTYRAEKAFYGSFDRNMRPIGPKHHLDGTLVFSIMATP